jgi:hypothetical protein
MVVAPALFFSALAVLYAILRLRKKPLELIRGASDIKVNKLTQRLQGKGSQLAFLKELKRNVLLNNLILIFFIGFAALKMSAASDKHSGHPPSSKNDEVLAEILDLVREDQRLTVREVA